MILPGELVASPSSRTRAFLALGVCCAIALLAVRDGWHLNMYEAKLGGYYESSYVRLKKAAEEGDGRAQNSLGNLYYLGLSEKRDMENAATWYKKAAFNGNSSAQINMGILHANGSGVALDLEKAYGWFRLAARNGNDRAKIYVNYMAERYSMAPNMTKDIENRFQTLSDFR